MKYQFRGYDENEEKWVCGYLIADNVILSGAAAHLVDEKSVSISTGYKDYCGCTIFINDIIKNTEGKTFKIEQSKGELIGVSLKDNHRYNLFSLLRISSAVKVIAIDYKK